MDDGDSQEELVQVTTKPPLAPCALVVEVGGFEPAIPKEMIEQKGVVVFLEKSWPAALEKAKKELPSLILVHAKTLDEPALSFLDSLHQIPLEALCVAVVSEAGVLSTLAPLNANHLQHVFKHPLPEVQAVSLADNVLQEAVRLNQLEVQEMERQNHLSSLEKFKQESLKIIEKQTLQIKRMHSQLDQSQTRLKTLFLTSIKGMMNLIENRYMPLAQHSRAVAELARALARETGVKPPDVEVVYHAALLHDIGKLSLPDSVLHPSIADLSGENRSLLMQHPDKAFQSLKVLSGMGEIAQLIRHHHERFDGKGFPDGLQGTQIPVGSRIIAIAEDFDELQRGWVAGKKLSKAEALAFITGSSGKRYDPLIVAKLDKALEQLRIAPKEHEKLLSGQSLTEGMVITRDLYSPEGMLLIAVDGVVTPAVIRHVLECEEHHNLHLNVYVDKNKKQGFKR